MALDAKIPEGPLELKWANYKDHLKLVSPANKRKLEDHCNRHRPRRSFRCRYFGRIRL